MILVDTSAWIEYFRATGSTAAVEVRRLLSDETGQIAMCEPIAMEILSGALNDNTYATLERLVNGLPSLSVDNAIDFRAAAGIYRAARRAGETVRSVNDCLIAALAIRHGARIVHRDADFDVIARITTLEAASFR
jgi:predicted nucleic acid-binding protein